MNVLPVPTQDQLADLHRSGLLAQELGSFHEDGADGADSLTQACVRAHNDGRMDLLATVRHPAFAELDTHAFFTAQHVFCDAIPDLQADADAVMACCQVLVTRAGDDLSGGFPNLAFSKWCANNPEQAVRVLDEAWVGKSPAIDFATFALVATQDAGRAIAFVGHFTDERRLYGMTALGRMTHANADAAQVALAALEPHLTPATADRTRANALGAAFGILSGHPDHEVVARVVDAAVVEAGPESLHALAQALVRQASLLDRPTTQAALGALLHVPQESTGTMRMVADGLHRMLGTAHEDLALDALSDLLRDGVWDPKHFSTPLHDIRAGDPARRDALVIRWLLSGSLALGDAAGELAGERRGGSLGFDLVLPPLSEAQQVLLAQKAVGFLFTKPKSCCAVLVAVIREGTDVARAAACELLFHPVLQSYASAVEYLSTVPDTDAAYGHVQEVLQRLAAYRAALSAIPDMKELYPSERQRHLARVRDQEMMRDAMKGADARSPLLSLFTTQHILHGRRTLAYVEGPGGERRAMPMDLNKHSVTMEMPSLEWVDPVGLSNLLMVYRSRKPS